MKRRTIIIISIIGIIGLTIVIYSFFTKDSGPKYEFITAEIKDIIQEVSVTGQVQPAEDVSLAFEATGKLATLNATIGDQVTKSQLLMQLNNSDLIAQLNQARASVESAQASLEQYQAALASQEAKLDEYKKGTRPEEIQAAQTTVLNAQNSLKDAEQNLTNTKAKAETDLNNLYNDIPDILNDVYTKANNAVVFKPDPLFDNDNGESPDLTFLTKSSNIKFNAEHGRYLAGLELEKIKTNLSNIPTDKSSLDNLLIQTQTSLNTIKSFLVKTNQAINDQLNLSAANILTYQTYINEAETGINNALSSINTQKQLIDAQKQLNASNISTAEASVTTAENTLLSAEDQLTLKRAGYTTEQIAAQEAAVEQAKANISSQQAQIKYAQANVQNITAKIEKTLLRAPIDGVITGVEAKVGEIIAPNVEVIKIISTAKYQIEADVPEVDIAKIKIDDQAKVSLDAYGSDLEFMVKVIKIDPAETIIDGVPTYKTTFEFLTENDLIKSGMTANLDILTAQKENVLVVPQRTVLKKNGTKYVRTLDTETKEVNEITVETGLRGSDGNIEILSGIEAGQEIIISTIED